MFHILGFIFFLVLIVFVIGLAILSKVVRTIFRAGQNITGKNTSQQDQRHNRQETYSSTASGYEKQPPRPNSQKKKIFDDNEGEYVEFEEIKDN